MDLTASELAALVKGHLCGDGSLVIRSARTLEDAREGDVTFVESSKHASRLAGSRASAAIVPRDFKCPGKTLIAVADPLAAFVVVFQHFQGKTATQATGIDSRAVIHPSAVIGEGASIGPFVSVGANAVIGKRCRLRNGVTIGENCRVGDDAHLYPNVVLYADTILGDRVTIHANAVIGADGFGYRTHQGKHVQVPHLSKVIIGSDVEIGACTCIDRGAFEPTIVGDGTKIDNLVQIAHNVRVGKHNLLAAQVGIAGSCSTGDYVFMGGQSGLSDHVHVADRCQFGAKTGVFQDVPAGKRQWLYPAHDDRLAARIIACLKKLPDMHRDLLRVLKTLNLTEVSGTPLARRKEKPAA